MTSRFKKTIIVNNSHDNANDTKQLHYIDLFRK